MIIRGRSTSSSATGSLLCSVHLDNVRMTPSGASPVQSPCKPALRDLNDRNRQRAMPEVAMGIGIATGDVVVGNIGSEKRSKFTAIGSAVNLAARLEGRAGGGEILISPQTYEDVQKLVDVERSDWS